MFTRWKITRASAYYKRRRSQLIEREKRKRIMRYANIRSDNSEYIVGEEHRKKRETMRDMEMQVIEG